MKAFYLIGASLFVSGVSCCQSLDGIINEKEITRVETILAHDDMKGRATFTPSIDKAAEFISTEFKKAGLEPLDKNGSYLQSFSMVQPKFISTIATINNQSFESKNVLVFTAQPKVKITEQLNYEKVYIKAGQDLFGAAQAYIQAGKNYIVQVDLSFARNFNRLIFLKKYLFKTDKNVVFILSNEEIKSYTIEAQHEITDLKLSNVVGVLPGKKLKNEYVIFSSHYDHIGVENSGKPDSIYNGANDDAAGTTAVISLAKYFKSIKNNERSIIFVAFTAEEIGGFGSQYFSNQLNPAKVAAMFNIEMIGTESKWGENSAYITGFDKTNMGEIMQKNLVGTQFKFYPDPYPEQSLFYRSDNATLARKGVPAHTISTSKMDVEPNYHKVSDEVSTLNLSNMTNIIKAIALSSTSIISGKDTPSRVDTTQLQ